MDELLEGMATSLSVTKGNIYEEHARYSKHKNEGKAAEAQRHRREAQLKRQKDDREAMLDRIRGLCNDDEPGTSEDVEMRNVVPRRTSPEYDDYLMFSEWLEDIPTKISKEWTMLFCPSGKRCLVVAKRGKTTALAKDGKFLTEIETALPGGSYSSPAHVTILDCIWNFKHGTSAKFFALDLICYKSQPMVDSEFECRRFVLKSRLEECAEERLPNPFIMTPSCPCTTEEMTKLINEDFAYRLDGLLFYYNEGFYIAGQTALVGWLKPFMLTDIFDIDVPTKYMSDKPEVPEGDNATRAFIEDFNKKYNHQSFVKQSGDVDGTEKMEKDDAD